jgi:hypothetical protein
MSFNCHSSFGPPLGHSLSKPLSFDTPLRCGPRHCGQSEAADFLDADDCAKALEVRDAIKKSVAINMKMRDLDFMVVSFIFDGQHKMV